MSGLQQRCIQQHTRPFIIWPPLILLAIFPHTHSHIYKNALNFSFFFLKMSGHFIIVPFIMLLPLLGMPFPYFPPGRLSSHFKIQLPLWDVPYHSVIQQKNVLSIYQYDMNLLLKESIFSFIFFQYFVHTDVMTCITLSCSHPFTCLSSSWITTSLKARPLSNYS